MSFTQCSFIACLGISLLGSMMKGQETASTASSTMVPRLVNYYGTATDGAGKIVTGTAGATFSIYKDKMMVLRCGSKPKTSSRTPKETTLFNWEQPGLRDCPSTFSRPVKPAGSA